MGVTLSTKGQIVIPKEIREACHWRPGQSLRITRTPSGGVLLEAEASPDDWLARMGGPEIDDFTRDLEANRPGLRRGDESLE